AEVTTTTAVPAAPSPLGVVEAFEAAFRSGDSGSLVALFSSDFISMNLTNGPTFADGERLGDYFEWLAVGNPRLELTGCELNPGGRHVVLATDIVRCDSSYTDDFFEIFEQDYLFAGVIEFGVEDGLLRHIAPLQDLDDPGLLLEVLEFFAWAEENRPEQWAQARDGDGSIIFTPESAATELRLAREWAATVRDTPGDS
ncbi:MAG: hypothetical protein ACE5KX_04270, partial [Acidimicrobiia bacterium]